MLRYEEEPSLPELLSNEQQARLTHLLSQLCNTPLCISDTPVADGVPVEFNLETLAWIGGGASRSQRQAAAELMAFVLHFVGKYRYAANIHHDVTEAAFAQLQQQYHDLQASEQRYRDLSNQLQHKVEEQVGVIRTAQQELYESSRLKSVGHLAAGVAHEINNPIGFITSNLRVARDYLEELSVSHTDNATRQALIDDFRALLDESIAGAKRIAGIVADLKTFSNIDSPDVDYYDINVLIRTATKLLTANLTQPITWTLDLAQLPVLHGHPAKLSQAIYNILDNSAKAIAGPGGAITITSGLEGDFIKVVIDDNGCGITPEVSTHAFDPFFTTRDVGAGTGLGLTVARDVIQAHGGKVDIASGDVSGTRVTLLLPTTRP